MFDALITLLVVINTHVVSEHVPDETPTGKQWDFVVFKLWPDSVTFSPFSQ